MASLIQIMKVNGGCGCPMFRQTPLWAKVDDSPYNWRNSVDYRTFHETCISLVVDTLALSKGDCVCNGHQFEHLIHDCVDTGMYHCRILQEQFCVRNGLVYPLDSISYILYIYVYVYTKIIQTYIIIYICVNIYIYIERDCNINLSGHVWGFL